MNLPRVIGYLKGISLPPDQGLSFETQISEDEGAGFDKTIDYYCKHCFAEFKTLLRVCKIKKAELLMFDLRVHRGPDSGLPFWHKDAYRSHYTSSGIRMFIVSSDAPTEFLMPDGSVFQAKPFEIVQYDTLTQHRTPLNLPAHRTLIRIMAR